MACDFQYRSGDFHELLYPLYFTYFTEGYYNVSFAIGLQKQILFSPKGRLRSFRWFSIFVKEDQRARPQNQDFKSLQQVIRYYNALSTVSQIVFRYVTQMNK